MNKKLKFNNYLGYGLCDLGNNLGFSCISAFLTVFYSDVIGKNFSKEESVIWGIATSVILIVARIWDGINDPMMGMIVQRHKPSKLGKFRPFIIYGGIPLALVIIVMFIPFQNLGLVGAIAFTSLTYIAYGMLYTVVLVPYGSLATVMTRDENERSLLSVSRSIGGGIGGIPCGMLLPQIVYTVIDGNKIFNGDKFFICVCIIAVIIVVSYLIGFTQVKENYPYNEVDTNQKVNFSQTFKSIIKNKPFIIMSLLGMLLIASSMFMNSMYTYIFKENYEDGGLMTFVTIATYIPMLICIPLSGMIFKKIGKKEFMVPSLIIATIASLVMYLWKIDNPWIFLIFVALQGVGVAFITLEIWALAMDVIDYQELLTGKREEAPSYALFTFMRKIGQALAAFVPAIVSLCGYVAADTGHLSDTVKSNLYNSGTLIPFIIFAIMTVLICLYPLSKDKYIEMKKKLAIQRGDVNE